MGLVVHSSQHTRGFWAYVRYELTLCLCSFFLAKVKVNGLWLRVEVLFERATITIITASVPKEIPMGHMVGCNRRCTMVALEHVRRGYISTPSILEALAISVSEERCKRVSEVVLELLCVLTRACT
jgi:hypothetical protein